MKKILAAVGLTMVLTLCACAPKAYEVEFDVNGGTLVSGDLTQTVDVGENATVPVVEKDGMTLAWNGSYSNIQSDEVITAQWTPCEYTVRFEENGGTLISGELTQTVTYGESAQAPVLESDHMTLSWDKEVTNITEDTVITAQWISTEMSSEEIAEYVGQRTVTVNVSTINGYDSSGSGFFIDSDGTLVTNYHVIDMGAEMSVQTYDGGAYDVEKVIAFAPEYDLAILKIDVSDTPYLEVSEDGARTGENVYAVGSALGFLDGTFTSGTVSSTSRTVGLITCIQTDAATSNGNSGGPLVNKYGEVIGVNSFSYISGESLNLAIHISELDKLTNEVNYSTNEFEEWYRLESARSYSPYDADGDYHYSIINTYQRVTGRSCLYSFDENYDSVSGYVDMCVYYRYEYVENEYDTYVSYLKSMGFVFDTQETYSDGISYYYTNEKDGVTMDLFVHSNGKYISIYPTC